MFDECQAYRPGLLVSNARERHLPLCSRNVNPRFATCKLKMHPAIPKIQATTSTSLSQRVIAADRICNRRRCAGSQGDQQHGFFQSQGRGAMIVCNSIDALDLSAFIRSGDSVVCSQGVAEPVALTRALVQQREAIGPFKMFIGPTYSDTFKPEHGDSIVFKSYCGTAHNAPLFAAGVLDIVPAHYSDLPRLFSQGIFQADVVLLTVGEPDEHGRFNLGLTNDYIIDAARRARVVIAEISDRVPWVHGAELPEDIHLHVAVHTSREPILFSKKSLDDASSEERAIAQWTSSLIPDGATLELGIGTLPDLVLHALRDHRSLGIHSGVLGDGVAELMKSGVINNAHKPGYRGISVAGLLMGSRQLLDFAHRNDSIR